jgi:tyrosyl-tRNA synthetase
MLHATTPGLPARLANGRPIAGYNGFDPSGPSLHVGHLVPIFGLLQLQRHGGRPIALVGGGTGMIGDPSGRSTERNLLDRATLEANVASIRRQLERFLDFSSAAGERGALLVNNLDWLGGIGLIDWLRDVGKHFTIPYMLAKDSVQVRLDRGLSFTEFSYMLIQATDFEHLHRTMGVELQMGGADQWGNITAGLELIRRRASEEGATGGAADAADPSNGGSAGEIDSGGGHAHGLAYKLLLSASGTKFGKTEGGDSVWLDPERTSPYAFHQYWLNVDDRDVGTYLRWFTLKPRDEIEALERATTETPELRVAQAALADDVTTRTHGPEATRTASRLGAQLFSREPIEDPAILEAIHAQVEGFDFSDAQRGQGIARFLVDVGVLPSLGEARRLIAGRGLVVNGVRHASPDEPVPEPSPGPWLLVRVGKKRTVVGRRRD